MKNNTNNKYKKNIYSRYNATSEAYSYSYDTQAIPLPKRRVKKKQKTIYRTVEENDKVLPIKIIIIIFVSILFITSAVYIEALSVQKRFEIDALNKTLYEITEDNINLETELAKSIDLEYIENVAVDKLGMQKPSSHQIIHINIPKESYSEKNNYIPKKNFIDKIISLFN